MVDGLDAYVAREEEEAERGGGRGVRGGGEHRVLIALVASRRGKGG